MDSPHQALSVVALITPDDIFVVVPTRGQVDHNTVRALQEIRDRAPGLAPIHYVAGRMSAMDTRNLALSAFLATDKQVMFTVDDDVVPHPKVLDMAQALETYDIMGAPYPIFRPPGPNTVAVPSPCAYRREGGGYKGLHNLFALVGVQPCDGIGTGCMMIPRRVLERLGPFAVEYDAQGVLTKTEDFVLCERAIAAGFTIGAHFDYPADHFVGCSLHAVTQGFTNAWKLAAEREQRRGRIVIP